MPMVQEIQTEPDEQTSLEARCGRLQVLVSELLQKNQELRTRVALLEYQAENMERGLAEASAWAVLLLP